MDYFYTNEAWGDKTNYFNSLWPLCLCGEMI
jgi:hypothetical protein